jgi:hypothetical protein
MLSSAGKEFEFEFLTISDSSSVFFFDLSAATQSLLFFSLFFSWTYSSSKINSSLFFFLNEG